MAGIPLIAQMMDGQAFDVSVYLSDSISDIKLKLSGASGFPASELTLLYDFATLEDALRLVDVVGEVDMVEVVLVRNRTVGTRALVWYDEWLVYSEATAADLELKDPWPWVRLASSLYSLGECTASWHAYRHAAHIANGFSKQLSDDELLTDETVGRYARVMDRAYRRNQWKFDDKRPLELMKLLAQADRAGEVASKNWETLLPSCYRTILVFLCAKIPPPPPLVSQLSSLRVGPASNMLKGSFPVAVGMELQIVQITFEIRGSSQTESQLQVICSMKRPTDGPRNHTIPSVGRSSRSRKRQNNKPALGDSLDDWDDDWDEEWDEGA